MKIENQDRPWIVGKLWHKLYGSFDDKFPCINHFDNILAIQITDIVANEMVELTYETNKQYLDGHRWGVI